MVMDQEPFSTAFLKNVGGLLVAFADAISNGSGKLLGAANPGHGAVHADDLYGCCHTHETSTLKDFLPALAYRFPSVQQGPSRMYAPDPIFLQPYRIHLFEIQILQGAVKVLIGIHNFLFFPSRFCASFRDLNFR